jgi:lipopolysaccharide transport system ATP-binding protein
VLERGRIIFNGDVEEAIQVYMKSGGADDETKLDLTKFQRPKSAVQSVEMTSLELVGKENNIYDKNEAFKFAVKWKALKDLQDVRFKIIVRNYLDAPVGVAKTAPIVTVKNGEE